MSGPTPKPAAMRQRRNKTTTHARLETTELPREAAPDLGEHPGGCDWHPRTEEWWAQVWASPMAEEFLQADEGGLHLLATLVDQFWYKPTAGLASEIRLQRQCYGLTPIDRRRLQWEVVRAEKAERARPQKQTKRKGGDPREALKAI